MIFERNGTPFWEEREEMQNDRLPCCRIFCCILHDLRMACDDAPERRCIAVAYECIDVDIAITAAAAFQPVKNNFKLRSEWLAILLASFNAIDSECLPWLMGWKMEKTRVLLDVVHEHLRMRDSLSVLAKSQAI